MVGMKGQLDIPHFVLQVCLDIILDTEVRFQIAIARFLSQNFVQFFKDRFAGRLLSVWDAPLDALHPPLGRFFSPKKISLHTLWSLPISCAQRSHSPEQLPTCGQHGLSLVPVRPASPSVLGSQGAHGHPIVVSPRMLAEMPREVAS